MAKIYVSSTFQDLQSHREQVGRVIHRMGHEDVALDYFVAEDQRPVEKCLADVSSCDLYVGIFAWRYGWQPKENNPSQLSVTEMEYQEAHKLQKECLIFLLDENVPWPKTYVDRDTANIENLRNTASGNHTSELFVTVAELARKVAEALHRWETRNYELWDSTATRLTMQQVEDFVQLVLASGLTLRRRYLCRQIGLDPDRLDFVYNTDAPDFATKLIAYCDEKSLHDALVEILWLVAKQLGNGKIHQAKIAYLRKVLEPRVLSPWDIGNQPSVFVADQRSSSIQTFDIQYIMTRFLGVLQTWSPLVIFSFFLLLLAPDRYEKYISRFENSTVRNIHISLGCFLAYLPLLILGFGADLKPPAIPSSELNWSQATWLAVVIAWLATMVIGRINISAIGDIVGLVIGILFSRIMGAEIPLVFGLGLGLASTACISITGGIAYAVALLTINDRNVQGAGIGAFYSTLVLCVILICKGPIIGSILALLTVFGAATVAAVVSIVLEERDGLLRLVFGVVTFVIYLFSLAFLFVGYAAS